MNTKNKILLTDSVSNHQFLLEHLKNEICERPTILEDTKNPIAGNIIL